MKKKILMFPLIAIGLLVVMTTNCKKTDVNNLIPEPRVPVVNTSSVSNITPTNAISGGEVTDPGDSLVTSRGVCWSTNQPPTISDNMTTNGAGWGSFTCTVTNLLPSTTYYIRAFAISAAGTGYGQTLSFITKGGIVDVDGNVYDTVSIGSQIWTVQNLKVTRLNDGTDIPNVTDFNNWKVLTTPAYSWYNNNEATYKPTYGGMYNWYAVNTGKLCPQGWHVPTYDDWLTLINFCGGEYEAGYRLKEKGTAHWDWPNTTYEETGFDALPGGLRDVSQNYDFRNITEDGFYWTSTADINNTAKKVRFAGSVGSVGIDDYSLLHKDGLSVRCVKD